MVMVSKRRMGLHPVRVGIREDLAPEGDVLYAGSPPFGVDRERGLGRRAVQRGAIDAGGVTDERDRVLDARVEFVGPRVDEARRDRRDDGRRYFDRVGFYLAPRVRRAGERQRRHDVLADAPRYRELRTHTAPWCRRPSLTAYASARSAFRLRKFRGRTAVFGVMRLDCARRVVRSEGKICRVRNRRRIAAATSARASAARSPPEDPTSV
jgi:hypothetical protein